MANITQKRLDELNCVMGLDCSKYQKDISWSKAKSAGIQFAFIKTTEGTTGHEDSIYNVYARAAQAQKDGIKIGYYHFGRPGNVKLPEDDANEELNNILATLSKLPKANLPFVLDIEAYSDTVLWTNKVDHMNRYITTLINGLVAKNIPVIVYSYKSFLDANSNPVFGTYPLWIAAYVKNPEVSLPTLPNGWKEWKIWQFTDKGTVDGYVGDLDLSIMKKDFFNRY